MTDTWTDCELKVMTDDGSFHLKPHSYDLCVTSLMTFPSFASWDFSHMYVNTPRHIYNSDNYATIPSLWLQIETQDEHGVVVILSIVFVCSIHGLAFFMPFHASSWN